MTMKLERIVIRQVHDPEVSLEGWNKHTVKAYEDGEFDFIGIYAQAELIDSKRTIQTIRSGGTWGVMDNSENAYIEEIKTEELDHLCHVLFNDLDIPHNDIVKAREQVEVKA